MDGTRSLCLAVFLSKDQSYFSSTKDIGVLAKYIYTGNLVLCTRTSELKFIDFI